MKIFLFGYIGIAVIAPSIATAQSATSSAIMIDALADCLRLKDDARRLPCLDAAAQRLVDAAARKDLVVLDGTQVRKTRRSLFGLTIDSGDLFAGRDAPADRIEALETTVKAAQHDANDRWTLTLAEGGRWQTAEAWLGDPNPRPGQPVSIHRGSLGSYILRANGVRTVKVRRVN